MSVYTKIAIPMFCVAFTMFHLARKKNDQNFLVPGYVLLAAGFVSAVLAITSG